VPSRYSRTRRSASLHCIFMFAFLSCAFTQESPTPTATPTPTTSPTPSPSPARNVHISFLPPPLEGRISLGIYDATAKLVRVLHREAELKDFTIGADALITTWDGKNDAGEDLAPGKYYARGYIVGDLKVESVARKDSATESPPPAADKVSVKLIANPLANDAKTIVDLVVGVDEDGSFLKTSDGLPLFTISETPHIARAQISQRPDKSLDVMQDNGTAGEEFRVTGAEKMMAFDCGDFELK
jgi:hypothetical protein